MIYSIHLRVGEFLILLRPVKWPAHGLNSYYLPLDTLFMGFLDMPKVVYVAKKLHSFWDIGLTGGPFLVQKTPINNCRYSGLCLRLSISANRYGIRVFIS